MKILHVITTINRGGAENHLCDLVKGLVAAGNSVVVAYLKGDGYWRKELEILGVIVVNLGLTKYGDLFPVWRLRKLILDLRPDIVHAHLPPAELYTTVALIGIKQIRFIVSKHVDSAFFAGSVHKNESIFGALVVKWIVQRAKRVICISDAVKNFITPQVGVHEGKLEVVKYGLCRDKFNLDNEAARQMVRAEFSVEKDALLIGTVARFVPQKSLHHLLHVVKELVYGRNVAVNLLLVGSGPLEAELRSLGDRLGVQDKVIWTGFREDIPRLMSALDIFVLTSKNEGFGLVLLEAMASRVPVVASNISAIPEVVEEGISGFLFPYGDIDSCVNTIVKLRNSEKRDSFGKAGRKRVEQEFSISKMVSLTIDIYQEALIT